MWACVDKAYGDFVVHLGFATKYDAISYAIRNASTVHVSEKLGSGNYEIRFPEEKHSSAVVCREEKLAENCYI